MGDLEGPRSSTTATPARPSSPRKFFARLYGGPEPERGASSDLLLPAASIIPPHPSSPDRRRRHHHLLLSRRNALRSNHRLSSSDHRAGGEEDSSFSSATTTPSFLFPAWWTFRNESTFYANGALRKEGRRPRRQRTTFTTEQTDRLEAEFRRSEYVSRTLRQDLARRLSLSETQVKIWFQNRRAKDKRIEKALLDNRYRNLALVTTSAVSIGFSSTSQHLSCPLCCVVRQQDDNNMCLSSSIVPKLHLSVNTESPCRVLSFPNDT